MRVVGVNLSAKEEKPTGICLVDDIYFLTKTLFRNEKIVNEIKNFRPNAVLINAALTVSDEPFRQCEKELIKRGFNFLPLNLSQIQELSKRAVKIKNELKDIEVMESYPGVNSKILKINKSNLLDFLDKNGFVLASEIKNDEEYNSLIIGITAWFYASGNYEAVGKDNEKIIIPKV